MATYTSFQFPNALSGLQYVGGMRRDNSECLLVLYGESVGVELVEQREQPDSATFPAQGNPPSWFLKSDHDGTPANVLCLYLQPADHKHNDEPFSVITDSKAQRQGEAPYPDPLEVELQFDEWPSGFPAGNGKRTAPGVYQSTASTTSPFRHGLVLKAINGKVANGKNPDGRAVEVTVTIPGYPPDDPESDIEC
jgi:hypothetical protein